MSTPDERKKDKLFDTRKSINFLVILCKKLDDSLVFPGLEYNLTVVSKEFIDSINSFYTGTSATKPCYSVVYTLRITRHIDKERLGPFYVCLVSQNYGFTYKPYKFCVLSTTGKILYEDFYTRFSSKHHAKCVSEFIKAVLKCGD